MVFALAEELAPQDTFDAATKILVEPDVAKMRRSPQVGLALKLDDHLLLLGQPPVVVRNPGVTNQTPFMHSHPRLWDS